MWHGLRDGSAFLAKQLSAILLLTMLNLIDAVTYGRLIIPVTEYSSLGMTMFLLSTSTVQLVLTLTSSIHSGVTGATIIENIPFIHTMYYSLMQQGIAVESAISTLLYACILATLLESLLFFMLACSGMDRLVHQFPRSVLVGIMGGIGVFLIKTALGLALDHPSNSSLSMLFIILIPSIFALFALFGEKRLRYPFVAPVGSVLLFALFHAILVLFGIPMENARHHGWLLPREAVPADDANATTFLLNLFTRLNPKDVNLKGLYSLLTTIVSMALFGLLHIPINIPSFARSTGSSFCMRQELLAHCYGNFASCFLGFVPGYFVYSNSVLFFKANAQGRLAGVGLSLTTVCLLFSISIASFIPIIMVMYLIMYLGVSLLYEAIVTAFVHRGMEGVIIMCTMIGMNVFDFVRGLLIGMFVASINALNHASKGSISIDGITGNDTSFPINFITRFRGPEQEAYLQGRMRHALRIIVIEGYSFFGNATRTLNAIECIPSHIQHVIVWFKDAHVYGEPDMNISEGIRGVLGKSHVRYYLVGVQMEGMQCFDEARQAIEAIREHILIGQETKEAVDEEVGVLLEGGGIGR